MECKSLIFRTTIASILLLGSYLPDVLADPAVKRHWSYYPSASIEVEIDAEIILFGTASNSADWTGPISGGYLYVDKNSTWTNYYDFSPEEISFGLVPGESTNTFLVLGVLSPVSDVPEAFEFFFESSLGYREGLDPSKDTLHPEQDLHVTVIPEPSSVLHMILGTGGILFYRRAKHRQQEQYINHRSYKWQKDHG